MITSPIKKILIVGGGPAGLMTAICLAEKKLDITLIDKGSWPADKICGEGIMPKGIKMLKKSGAFAKINPESCRAFNGITYINNNGDRADGNFLSGRGYVVRRTALSKALYQRALEFSNIKLIPKTEISDIKEFEEYSEAIVKDLQEYSLGKFDLIIGCDGLKSKVRKLSNLDAAPPAKRNRVGSSVHYQTEPWNDKVEVMWQDGIEAYIAPVSGNCVNFIFGWNRDVIKFNKTETIEEQLFNYFPDLKKRINGKKALSEFRAIGSLATVSAAPIKGRTVLIGDAGCFLDPTTGEGISKAFEEAGILADTIHSLHTKAGIKLFQKKIKKNMQRYFMLTRGAMMLMKNSFFRKFIIKVFARFVLLFEFCLEMNIGNSLFDIVRLKYRGSKFPIDFFHLREFHTIYRS